MGDPRKLRKKYQKPSHPWQKERIEEEKNILKEYGLKNKKEAWKMSSILRNFKTQAKRLITTKSIHAEKEKRQLMDKLSSYGLLKKAGDVGDILDISLRNILDRRLQTFVFKKQLSRSVDQARQFIVHGHILVGDKKITAPSYLVAVKEEALINFSQSSKIFDPEHPERVEIKEEKPKKKKAEKKESKPAKEKKPKLSKAQLGPNSAKQNFGGEEKVKEKETEGEK